MKFHCTYCGHGIEAGGHALGALVLCPACTAEVPVPSPPGNLQFLQVPSSVMNSCHSQARPAWGRELQRVFLYSLLVCLAIGAGAAILALSWIGFGEIQVKIILTTLSLGVYSLTGLCCAAVADQRQLRAFGGLGIGVSVVGGMFAVLTNWEIITGWELLLKGRFCFLILGLAFAHASLLLRVPTTNSAVLSVRNVTLGIIALLAVLLLSVTINPKVVLAFWALLGTLGVLDLLGTVATPILHVTTRDHSSK